MEGTSEGEHATSTGISLLSFDEQNRIAESIVYRQALPAEVAMAKRAKKAVEQNVLLEKRD